MVFSYEYGCLQDSVKNKSVKQFVENMKHWSELKTTEYFEYVLTHTYDEEPRRLYVLAPYDYNTFNVICAYIQFEMAEIDESYSIDQTEVIECLERYYNCYKLDESKCPLEVNLYINWETHCGSDIQSIEILRRDEGQMSTYFSEVLDNWYDKSPEWRP